MISPTKLGESEVGRSPGTHLLCHRLARYTWSYCWCKVEYEGNLKPGSRGEICYPFLVPGIDGNRDRMVAGILSPVMLWNLAVLYLHHVGNCGTIG